MISKATSAHRLEPQNGKTKADKPPREDGPYAIGEKINRVVFKYLPYVLGGIVIALWVLHYLLKRRFDDNDNDDDADDYRFVEPRVETIHGNQIIDRINPADTRQTARYFLERHGARGPEGLPAGCIQLYRRGTKESLLPQTRDLLARSAVELSMNPWLAPRSLTAYLAEYWHRRGVDILYDRKTWTHPMIMAQDSMERGTYIQAGIKHKSAADELAEQLEEKDDLDARAAMQLHKLTASLCYLFEAYDRSKIDFFPNLVFLEAGRAVLDGEGFELLPHSLHAAAHVTRAMLVEDIRIQSALSRTDGARPMEVKGGCRLFLSTFLKDLSAATQNYILQPSSMAFTNAIASGSLLTTTMRRG